jgi:hypothetical protein
MEGWFCSYVQSCVRFYQITLHPHNRPLSSFSRRVWPCYAPLADVAHASSVLTLVILCARTFIIYGHVFPDTFFVEYN